MKKERKTSFATERKHNFLETQLILQTEYNISFPKASCLGHKGQRIMKLY